jgi:hypothetical protein
MAILIVLFIITSMAGHGELTSGATQGADFSGQQYDQYPIPADEDCSELRPGQSIILNDALGINSPALRKYRLTRLAGANLFQIDLNLNFVPTDEYQEPRQAARPDLPSDIAREPGATVRGALDDEARARMLGRVNRCLELYQGRLRSPDGTQLRIRVHSSRQSEVPQHDIRISNTERSNVGNWSGAAHCGTMIHELLHIMGLCDGYPEMSNNAQLGAWRPDRQIMAMFSSGVHGRRYTEDFPCRPIEPEHSIMNNSHRALVSSAQALVCRHFRRIPLPSEFHEVSELPQACPRRMSKESASFVVPQSFRSPRDGYVIYHLPLQSPPANVLMNAHTRFITRPRCVSANRRYLTCTQDAYRRRPRDCSTLPPYCSDQSYLQ